MWQDMEGLAQADPGLTTTPPARKVGGVCFTVELFEQIEANVQAPWSPPSTTASASKGSEAPALSCQQDSVVSTPPILHSSQAGCCPPLDAAIVEELYQEINGAKEKVKRREKEEKKEEKKQEKKEEAASSFCL